MTATKGPKCSFCPKTQDQVCKLITAPGVYICDECVDLCNEIMTEEGGKEWNWILRPEPSLKGFSPPTDPVMGRFGLEPTIGGQQ